MTDLLHIRSLFLLLPAATLLFVPYTINAQENDRIVPRHPGAIDLPELGRMTCQECGFGREIYPLPDVNGDSLADFLTTVLIADTGDWGSNAKELRLYTGVRGGLPDINEYLRIGPSEMGTNIFYMAHGDWDNDGNPDIATKLTPIEKDPETNPEGYGLSFMVIWWGNTDGLYSIADTTHLSINAQAWLGPQRGYGMDFTGDGIDDLLLDGISGFQDGAIKRDMPRIQMFYGEMQQRWKTTDDRFYDWGWWGDKPGGHLILSDQDVDGLTDLVFYDNTRSPLENGGIRIIYGKQNVVIDTSRVVEVDYTSVSGKYSLLADITGDRVPELLVATGDEETLRVYAGFKGQRIEEQFGDGNEPASPGEEQWWGKPWANIPLVNKLHDGWASAGWGPIFDFGDGGLDGTDDLWVESVPDIIFYNGGERFDSIYDGWVNIPCGGGSLARLGDIDGSNELTIAIGYQCGTTAGIKFVQPSKVVPTGGIYRMLPPGTDTVSGVADEDRIVDEQSILKLRAIPNPANGLVRVRWENNLSRAGSEAVVRVSDGLGQEVQTLRVRGTNEIVWDASTTFGGTYFITLSIGEHAETVRALLL